MKSLTRFSLLIACLLVLAACTQTSSGPDYRNEVGANGLLTPRALFTRYVEAIGGEDVIRSHSSTTLHGRFILSAFGIEGDATIYSAAPNHLSQVIELGGFGTVQTGYNGEIGWSVDPLQGNSILEGDALTDLVQQSDYYLPLNLGESEGQETQELTQSGGSDAYKVMLTDSRGKETFLYFSAQSGLLVRSDTITSSPAGEVPTTTLLSEYRDFGGYMQPTLIVIDAAGQEFSIEVDEITFDDVSDTQFTPPAAIQSLLQRR